MQPIKCIGCPKAEETSYRDGTYCLVTDYYCNETTPPTIVGDDEGYTMEEDRLPCNTSNDAPTESNQ